MLDKEADRLIYMNDMKQKEDKQYPTEDTPDVFVMGTPANKLKNIQPSNRIPKSNKIKHPPPPLMIDGVPVVDGVGVPIRVHKSSKEK